MSDVLALTVPALLAGVGLYGALTGTDVFSALTAGALDGCGPWCASSPPWWRCWRL